jgi:hypothetical protein
MQKARRHQQKLQYIRGSTNTPRLPTPAQKMAGKTSEATPLREGIPGVRRGGLVLRLELILMNASTECLFSGHQTDTHAQKHFLCKNCAIILRIAHNGLDSRITPIFLHNYSTFFAQFCPTFIPVLSRFLYSCQDGYTNFIFAANSLQ